MRLALVAAALLAVSLPLLIASACGGQAGSPASPMPVTNPAGAGSADTGVADGAGREASPPPTTVTLGAKVQDLTTQAPIANVLVVVEVGGLDQKNPSGIGADGGPVATVAWDPFYEYGALTNDAGLIALSIPGTPVGLHAFANGYLEGTGGPWDAGPDAGSIPLRFLGDLPEAGAPERPRLQGLTADPVVASPGTPVLFTVLVDSPATGALSQQVILVLPATHQAWGLSAPSPTVPGGVYPPGVYSRIVNAPGVAGSYTYDVVAAALGGTVSDRASLVLTVTPDGIPSFADSGGPPPLDGGLPDGRR